MTFELIEKKQLSNINSEGYLYKHKKTKATLVFLKNDDINKSFSIGFKTIPYNDNGIFHILEHSVLCGSEKYPVKEPFVELLKGSFNTFINAMTFPDKTVYPVASKNEEDLTILMDIYLDAVFNPKLLTNNKILKQEGWHYHLENKEDTLIYKGVVYNEMKGVYSSVDEKLDDYISASLFTNNYKYSYGGLPEAIPSLTQEEFVNIYNHCYHPSNSFIVLYGDLDIEKQLLHLEEYLSKYDFRDYSSYLLENQTSFDNSIKKHTYFIEDSKDKSYVAYNYIIGDSTDYKTISVVDTIDDILFGSSNTEFRKYFLNKEICEDIYGFTTKDRKEAVFTIVFKHVKDKELDTLDVLYKEKLSEIINNGFDYEQIQATINKKNFSIKEEVNKTSSPKGISYAIKMMRPWLNSSAMSPLDTLNIDVIIKNLEDIHAQRDYENIAKKLFLNNKKTSVVHLISSNEKDEEKTLASFKESLSELEIENIINETVELQNWQNSQDPAEELEKIKSVDAKKVKLKNPFLPTNFEQENDFNYSHYEIQTNGISYSRLLFDISDFSLKEIQYSTLFTYLLFNLNTKNKTELELVKDINYNLGDINSVIHTFKDVKSDKYKIKFVISAKNIFEKNKELVDIIKEATINPSFEDKEAIYNILLEVKLSLENKFKNAGHAFVSNRNMSYAVKQYKLLEYISGYDFYLFITNIIDTFNENFEQFKTDFEKIVANIFRRNNVLVNYTGDSASYFNYKNNIKDYLNCLKDINYKGEGHTIELPDSNYSEGFYFDTMVQYVGLSGKLKNYSGTSLVLRHILSLDYLWNNVRVKNGAYGSGFSIYNLGVLNEPNPYFNLWSYRDPSLVKTLDTYYNIYDYIKNINMDSTVLNKYIIGALNTVDTLLTPNQKSMLSLTQHLTNKNSDDYDRLIEEIKNTDVASLRKLAVDFEDLKDTTHRCIIGSKENIYENKELFNNIIELK